MDFKNIKILVVDDSDIILNSIKEYLKEFSAEIITCSDGMEGIKNVVELKPDVIILDIMMPNIDGLKMLKLIKSIKEFVGIPVLIISGATNKTNVTTALEIGASKVLSKPLRKQEVINSIREILGYGLRQNHNAAVYNEMEFDDEEITGRLTGLFFKRYSGKKRKIMEYLDKKDSKNLFFHIHDLKGTGEMIGYPAVSSISGEIEKLIQSKEKNWERIKIRCENIFSILDNAHKKEVLAER